MNTVQPLFGFGLGGLGPVGPVRFCGELRFECCNTIASAGHRFAVSVFQVPELLLTGAQEVRRAMHARKRFGPDTRLPSISEVCPVPVRSGRTVGSAGTGRRLPAGGDHRGLQAASGSWSNLSRFQPCHSPGGRNEAYRCACPRLWRYSEAAHPSTGCAQDVHG